MGHPLRIQHEDYIYFVTNRCFQERFFFQPDEPFIAQLCRGALAEAVNRYKVKVFTFTFMGNHFHLIVQAPLLNLDAFMKHFQSQLARRINRHRGRHGTFFHGRYTSSPILDEEQLAQKVVYTLLNPVAAGLVEHPWQWAGASAYESHVTGQPVEGRWMNFRRVARYGRKHGLKGRALYNEAVLNDTFFDNVSLELAPLPLWQQEGLDERQRSARLEQMVEEGLTALHKETTETKRSPNTRSKLRNAVFQHWSARPKNPKRGGIKPLCHTNDSHQRRLYRAYYSQCVQSYRAARAACLADPSLPHRFPHGTIPCVRSKSAAGSSQTTSKARSRGAPGVWNIGL